MKAIASLEDIKARCIEVGECWEWQGNISSNGVPTACLPTVYPKQPGTRSARVTINALAWECRTGRSAQGKQVWRSCCNHACVNPAHMRAGTREQMCEALAKLGTYKRSPGDIAAITKGKRKAGKLSIEQAREIRASSLSGIALAPIYGVDKSLISRIRRGEAWRETSLPSASVFTWGGA